MTAIALLAAAQLGGCRKHRRTTAARHADAAIAQADAARDVVGFRIVATHAGRTPLQQAPWHGPGGDWTFYDATLADGTPFGLGLRLPQKKEGLPIPYGDGMLTVPDAKSGARIVERIASMLHVKAPAERAGSPLRFRPFGARARDLKGSIVSADASSTTVFVVDIFDLDLQLDVATGAGHFAEREPSFANSIIEFLAEELRDGLAPRRTPASDPALSASGPKLGVPRKLPGNPAGEGFSSDVKVFWTTERAPKTGSVVFATPLDGGPTTELLRIEGRLDGFACAGQGDVCVVADHRPTDWSGYAPSRDPTFIIVTNPREGTRVRIEGPWGDRADLPKAPLGPDGKWVAVGSWTNVDAGHHREIHFVDLRGTPRVVRTIDFGTSGADVEVFAGTAGDPEAIVMIAPFSPGSRRERIKVLSGARSPVAWSQDDELRLSPDHKHRLTCLDQKAIEIENLTTKARRTFTFHADDRVSDGCGRWVHPRWIEIYLGDPMFLDIGTMKTNFALDFPDRLNSWSYSNDFRWAFRSDDNDTWLAKVERP